MERQWMLLVVAVKVALPRRGAQAAQPQHPRHRHYLCRDVPTILVIRRVRLDAHAPTTYQSHIALLTVVTVAAGLTVAPSMIRQSTGWRLRLLVVVAVVAPRSMASRCARDTLLTRPLAKRCDAAAGTFFSAAAPMIRMLSATLPPLVPLARV